MFLPSGWFTPVLPPTEESTCAITVVGTCTGRMCRSRLRHVHEDSLDTGVFLHQRAGSELLRPGILAGLPPVGS